MIKQDKFQNDYESTQAYIEDKDGRIWQVLVLKTEYVMKKLQLKKR